MHLCELERTPGIKDRQGQARWSSPLAEGGLPSLAMPLGLPGGVDERGSGRFDVRCRLGSAGAVAVLTTLAPGFGSPCRIVGKIAAAGTSTLATRLGGAIAIIGEVAWIAALVGHKNFSHINY